MKFSRALMCYGHIKLIFGTNTKIDLGHEAFGALNLNKKSIEATVDMANSKYEYVKSFEIEDEVMYPNLVVVRIDGCNFERFSEINEFEKPNDEKALNLMNSCATSVLEKYPDIILAYGFSDEYSFIFKKETKFYQRRASEVDTAARFFPSLSHSSHLYMWKNGGNSFLKRT
ncbi:unnamed protein product [Lactuca saligna]|uniref:tRNAHis guanylyltransferase catalytic domain-containing protein n=1 Tax=Lactuca saligna TaxID=75948 RepID=A0AA35ZHZ9_LACSI|nr:unnamed protein product [Lactuca saligna]